MAQGPDVAMYSVKITNVPRDTLDNQALYEYMNALFPGQILQVCARPLRLCCQPLLLMHAYMHACINICTLC
jgi:hypothetical protein